MFGHWRGEAPPIVKSIGTFLESNIFPPLFPGSNVWTLEGMGPTRNSVHKSKEKPNKSHMGKNVWKMSDRQSLRICRRVSSKSWWSRTLNLKPWSGPYDQINLPLKKRAKEAKNSSSCLILNSWLLFSFTFNPNNSTPARTAKRNQSSEVRFTQPQSTP